MKYADEISIGVLDIYTQEQLNRCIESLPQEVSFGIVSNTIQRHVPSSANPPEVIKHHSREVSLGTMKNDLLHFWRTINPKKYHFIIHSNQVIQDPQFFVETIENAKVFGTWFMSGNAKSLSEIEDEESKRTCVIGELNTEVLFILDSLIDHIGFFDERYYNAKDLDTLDYIARLRTLNLTTPANYYPIVSKGLTREIGTIRKIGYSEDVEKTPDLKFSYGLFAHMHKWVPGYNELPKATEAQLMESLDSLQKNYAQK